MKYEIVDAQYVNAHLNDTAIVDVRPGHMYAESRIPGALSIPYMAWREEYGAAGEGASGANRSAGGMKLGDLFKAKGIYENTHVIVYCYNGGLAREACAQLHDEGFYHIHCYEGSWVDWVSDAGNPVDDRPLDARA